LWFWCYDENDCSKALKA